jgi:sucrose phosphorylase
MRHNDIAAHLSALYGDQLGRATFDRLQLLIANYQTRVPVPRAGELTERDAILITYGDQVREPNVPPLQTLADFCARHLAGVVSGIHLLPFYPYSSDDGFAVIDYRAVNSALGNWDDVARLGQHFRLMFDAVINHVSASSAWFQGFQRDEPRYRDYFIVAPDGVDLSRVVRPRALPVLTRFATPGGAKNVWTTFSADQIDLNYRNPDVLLEIVDALLGYMSRGAEFIRLDAIAYLWKEIGTPCIHLPQTHRVLQLFRAVLDEIAPHVMLVTETNVPHADNVAYFGDGTNEAHLVYNFALSPLMLHAFHTGSAATLARWAAGLALPSRRVTFFNFLASHDGIGLNPARGILTDAEINALAARAQAHGGLVSCKNDPGGGASPYELNINYFDALSDANANEPLDTQIDRFIAAHAIMLALVGVPGIYFHSLFGSRGWRQGVALTGRARAINREKLARAALEHEVSDAASRRHRVFARWKQLLQVRAAHPAFHPHGEQRVADCGAEIFAVLRGAPRGEEQVLCLHNVSDQPRVVESALGFGDFQTESLTDLVTNQSIEIAGSSRLRLHPYQFLWLTQGRPCENHGQNFPGRRAPRCPDSD